MDDHRYIPKRYERIVNRTLLTVVPRIGYNRSGRSSSASMPGSSVDRRRSGGLNTWEIYWHGKYRTRDCGFSRATLYGYWVAGGRHRDGDRERLHPAAERGDAAAGGVDAGSSPGRQHVRHDLGRFLRRGRLHDRLAARILDRSRRRAPAAVQIWQICLDPGASRPCRRSLVRPLGRRGDLLLAPAAGRANVYLAAGGRGARAAAALHVLYLRRFVYLVVGAWLPGLSLRCQLGRDPQYDASIRHSDPRRDPDRRRGLLLSKLALQPQATDRARRG